MGYGQIGLSIKRTLMQCHMNFIFLEPGQFNFESGMNLRLAREISRLMT